MRSAQATGFFRYVIVDGSFITDEDSPNDIDLILVLRPDHDFNLSLRPFEYNLLSKRSIRREYGFDVVIAIEASEALDDYAEFFSRVRNRPDLTKGLVRLSL